MTINQLNTTAARNPLVEKRADPWAIKVDGTYYFTGSYPEYDRIVLRGAATLEELHDAQETVIWTRPVEGEMGGNIWAPELHHLDGKWYFYFTAGHSDKPFRIRMYVLEGIGEDPRTATWGEPRRIVTEWDEFSLDATVFEHNDELYYVWAQRPIQEEGLADGVVINSDLYISKMSDPFTLVGSPVLLTTPEYDWENVGFRVNEGAAVVKRNGRVFITFSASATDHHYCMGLLWADENADLVDAQSWSKSTEPVFVSSDLTKAYGPGHNSFTVDENGNDMIVFHARSYRDIIGNSLFDHNRHGRIQPFFFNDEGFPVFGMPAGDGQVPNRLINAAGEILSITVDSVADAKTGADVIGESWIIPTVTVTLENVMEVHANANNMSVSRSLFRVLEQDSQSLVLEPVLARGQRVTVPASEWQVS